jgi:heat shock protein HslJ
MKNIILLIVLSLLAQIVRAQSNDITLYVANHKGEIKTVSMGITKCYLIKESASEEWKNFNGMIEDFKYKEGYDYELLVEKVQAINPPGDLPSYNYKLKSVVSKKPTMKISSHDKEVLNMSKFTLKKMRIDGDFQQVSNNKMVISFLLNNNSVSGNDGCNDFMGRIEMNKNRISFLNLSGTKMFCADTNLDKIFNTLIYDVDKYKLNNKHLKLYKGKKLLFEYEIMN